MVSEVQQVQLRRLKEKHADGLLLWELKNGFELSPRESDLVLETAKGILLEGKTLERGKHRVVGVTLGESAGKTIEEVKKKEVVVTLDGGIEDIEYEKRHGRMALRSMRMLRVIEEGIERGGCWGYRSGRQSEMFSDCGKKGAKYKREGITKG